MGLTLSGLSTFAIILIFDDTEFETLAGFEPRSIFFEETGVTRRCSLSTNKVASDKETGQHRQQKRHYFLRR